MRKMLLGVTAWLAVGCGGLTVGGSTAAEDIQPPTPVPPWCRECPDGIAKSLRVESTDPVSAVDRLARPDLAGLSLSLKCQEVWPNDLERLVRYRGYLAELYQAATGPLRAWCDEQLRLVDTQISAVETQLSTCP